MVTREPLGKSQEPSLELSQEKLPQECVYQTHPCPCIRSPPVQQVPGRQQTSYLPTDSVIQS